MREIIKNQLVDIINKYNIQGEVLEIGGYTLCQSGMDIFTSPKFKYFNLDIEKSDIPNTIIADITNCKHIHNERFNFIFCTDTFEHIDKPWLAAREISRILKKNGYVFIYSVWSWRYHPCPIDYWRFSPDCLKFLFEDLECLEANFDISQRRDDIRGFWENKKDYVPIDELGGWRENWGVYYLGKKT